MARCFCGRDAGWLNRICDVCCAKDNHFRNFNNETFTYGKKVKFTQGFYAGQEGTLVAHNGKHYEWGLGGDCEKYRIKLENGDIVEEKQFNLELINNK